jgi:sugar (pentulose or hexulose) kinase
MWFKNHLPDLYSGMKQIYSNQRYTMKMLGLEPLSDYSMAGRFMIFDIDKHCWARDIVEYIGLQEDFFGKAVPAATVIGEIDRFGAYTLPYKIPVIPGAHDSSCGMLGTGNTSGTNTVISNVAGTFDHYGRHDFTGRFHGLRSAGCIDGITPVFKALPSGSVIEWFMQFIHKDKTEEAYKYFWQNAKFDGTGALVTLPFFYLGRGGFLNLRQDSTQEDIFTSIIETLIFEAKKCLDGVVKDIEIKADALYAGGGPSRSEQLNQHKANVFGLVVKRLKNSEVSALGAAILGAVAMNHYPDIEIGMETMVQTEKEYYPDPELYQIYLNRFKEYETVLKNYESFRKPG